MGVGNCEDRCEASLPFGIKLGDPLREDIVHLATIFARADGTRWQVDGGVPDLRRWAWPRAMAPGGEGEGIVVHEV